MVLTRQNKLKLSCANGFVALLLHGSPQTEPEVPLGETPRAIRYG